MESLAGSGYRAVTETVVTVVAWPPLATCHTRFGNIVPETLGSEGSETTGRHGHVNQAFQKI
jgi:hypothetical protein